MDHIRAIAALAGLYPCGCEDTVEYRDDMGNPCVAVFTINARTTMAGQDPKEAIFAALSELVSNTDDISLSNAILGIGERQDGSMGFNGSESGDDLCQQYNSLFGVLDTWGADPSFQMALAVHGIFNVSIEYDDDEDEEWEDGRDD